MNLFDWNIVACGQTSKEEHDLKSETWNIFSLKVHRDENSCCSTKSLEIFKQRSPFVSEKTVNSVSLMQSNIFAFMAALQQTP